MEHVRTPRTDPGIDADFGQLWSTERAAMVRLATLLTGSPAAAEDVVQDAFEQVSRRWPTLQQPGAYLRRSVVNGCSMVLRRRSTEIRHRSVLAGAIEHDVPSHLVELNDALARLSDRQRTVVVLRYLLDLTDTEIAETLDVAASTVRSLARRGLARLRKELP